MMKSMAMLISLLFAGCASVEETNQISMAERVLNAVPPTVVAQIPAKLADFKPGMNISQVHDLLGIKSEHKFLSRGGGPFSNYHLIYHLRQGYNLVVYVDMTKEFPYPVHNIKLAGSQWKHLHEEEKETQQNP